MGQKPKTLKDLIIKGSKQSSSQLVDIIRQFCVQSKNYKYMKTESDKYALHIGVPGCKIETLQKEPFPLLAFAERGNGLYLTNIVPKTVSEIGIVEYNQFLDSFVQKFKLFTKRRYKGIRILTTSGLLTLENIISSKQALKFFSHFLHNYPLSMHPLDIERLDIFICTVFRYTRKPLDLDLLSRYLREVEKWNVEHIKWCINRIQIGHDVLKTRKKM